MNLTETEKFCSTYRLEIPTNIESQDNKTISPLSLRRSVSCLHLLRMVRRISQHRGKRILDLCLR